MDVRFVELDSDAVACRDEFQKYDSTLLSVLKACLDSENPPISVDEIDVVVDLFERFNAGRMSSPLYFFLGYLLWRHPDRDAWETGERLAQWMGVQFDAYSAARYLHAQRNFFRTASGSGRHLTEP